MLLEVLRLLLLPSLGEVPEKEKESVKNSIDIHSITVPTYEVLFIVG